MIKYNLVALGELLVEFSEINNSNRNQEENNFYSTLFEKKYSGDVLNTLFYANRLGLKCGLITCFGADMHTPDMLKFLDIENINHKLCPIIENKNNGLYFIEKIFSNKNVIEKKFHYWRSNSAATDTLLNIDAENLEQEISNAEYFYFTGVTLAVLQNRSLLLTLLKKISEKKIETKIIFDTNFREKLWGSRENYINTLRLFMPYIHIFMPSSEDIEILFDKHKEPNYDFLKRELYINENCLVVLKQAEKGCSYFISGRQITLQPIETQVVETTGAGDSFNAGFITGLVRGYSIEAALCLAQMTSVQALKVSGGININFLPNQTEL